jgi:hypothetical protein
MEEHPQQTRQALGCGYEPQLEGSRTLASYNSDVTPTVCPGYSTALPETIEVARARLHWSKGALTSFCAGRASEAVMTGIEILEGASNACQSWAMDNPIKKGG